MRFKSKLTVILLVSLLLTAILVPAIAAAQSTSTITGRVTYQGNYMDGVKVELVGGSSDTTKDGGYYTLSVVPNIAVTVRASYGTDSQTKTVMAGEAGSTVTQNFDLAPLSTASPISQALGPNTVTIVGQVKYDGNPLSGVDVNVSPVTVVTTDNSGQYQAGVPGNLNVTVSVVTAAGSDSKSVVTPASGTMVVNLNVSATGAATPTAEPTPTPEATATPVPTATETITATPAPTATAVPATPTAAPAGSELTIALAAIGILAAIGLFRRK
ncbi:carboxypeptidase-like regulatory domain-containing protein [Methanocella arvoryzae]|uniref:Uncharacterized protein n=1 Tax=Methanocella arvoryzae (strain DSM 22066 / NBRC 105507 / MRE50) TaxID=351160 RepID=Q0W0N0_METAR|nr:carboxypeptidase-like regulatory domain-containing protein [Methanocella arvoryzae]CAJ38063.1 hypothetical protein RRC343 [Methanocella arvoryzae MRE50]